MSKVIVLLDVDGVLIHARAYRAAAKASVEYMARRMGQPHITGPEEADLLAFEARSIISEWDSIALCVAKLLSQAPDLLGDSLSSTLDNIANSGRHLQQPDFATLARRCPSPTDTIQPGPAALGTLFPQEPAFIDLLGSTHLIGAPMTAVFQNYTLGHSRFEETYAQTAQFEADSLLETLDVPILDAQIRDQLLNNPEVFPSIYTARPGLPPGFVTDHVGYAAEAELARQQVGLDAIPVIGYGKMRWLALRHGKHDSDYVKPSPMQATVAILSALLHGAADWERSAYDIATNGAAIPDTLKDEPWHVVVCEDSTGGIRGVRAAVEALRTHHEVTFTAVGIAQDARKVDALREVADFIADDVNAGLARVLGQMT